MEKRLRPLRQLLEVTEQHLRSAKQDKYGVIKCQTPGLFWVRITPATIDKTLSLIEQVARAAAENGYPIDHQGATGFSVNGVSISAFFSEVIRRVDHVATKEEMAKPWYKLVGPQRFDFFGSGQLKVEFAALAGSRTFTDVPGQSQIDEMMQALLDLEVRSKKELERIDARTALSRVAEARRDGARKAAEARMQALAELEDEATKWVQASNIRAYIAALELRTSSMAERTKAMDWIKMAKEYVESINPIERRLRALAQENEMPPGDARSLI